MPVKPRKLFVTADGPPATVEKVRRKPVARHYKNAVYWESADNVRAGLQAMRQALTNDPTEEAFWYLVQDESDNSFVEVNVTIGAWHQAAQAAINVRKSDFGLTSPNDCGFTVVMTRPLSEREQLLKWLTPKKPESLSPETGRQPR